MDTFRNKMPVVEGMHTHNGIQFPAYFPKHHLNDLANLNIDARDWNVVGYPKSGKHISVFF